MTQTVSAPAKVILFGEHAVVYGQPAIAVPVSTMRATATVQQAPAERRGLYIQAMDLDEMLPVDLESNTIDSALALTARLVIQGLNIALPDALITLESTIPMASGLGSGAAVSAALGRAVAISADVNISTEHLNNVVYEVEKIYHGTPSGIDNTVIVYEKPIFFVRDQPVEFFDIASPFTIMVGDTGEAALTKVAVGDVRRLYEADPVHIQPVLDTIGNISCSARDAITSGNIAALGPLMNENHACLRRLGVSADGLERLIAAAIEAGAAGAKLSGGGRGGNMIALVTNDTIDDVRRALLDAGAARVFTLTII